MVEGVVRLHCLSDVGILVQSPLTNLTCGWHVDTVCKVPTNCEMVVLDNQIFADKLVDTFDLGTHFSLSEAISTDIVD